MKRSYILLLSFIFISSAISQEIVKFNFTPIQTFEKGIRFFDTSDDKKESKDRPKLQNPFRNLDTSWFKEKDRLDKIFIAAGVSSMAIGLPLLLVGLISYFLPNTDTSDLGTISNFSLIGVGSGLIGVGAILVITGVIRINYFKNQNKQDKKKISFLIKINFDNNYFKS